MRVVLANRSTSKNVLAGDAVQQFKTAEALRQMGVVVEIAEGCLPPLEHVDLVHLFNIIPVEETYQLFLQAKRVGIPIVLSPIYWEPEEFLMHGYSDHGWAFKEWWQKTHEQRRILLQESHMVLPNGQGELKLLQKTFGNLAPAKIIPNAADSIFYLGRPERFRRKFGKDRFILCVGRISRRKNQLGLIRALSRLDYHIVFIGPVNDFDYYRECRAEPSRGRVTFMEALPPTELASAYAAAELHILPSWYETPGLATLEAALAGSKVVSTNRGTAYEYLGREAWYCDPSDLPSIRSSVQEALIHHGYRELREKIRVTYNWENVAELTLAAYREVLTV